jgi:hypothetical protein
MEAHNMKQRIKRGMVYVAIGFVAVFLARLTYGYLSPTEQAVLSQPQVLSARNALSDAVITNIGGRGGAAGFSKGNYASEKLKVQYSGDTPAYSVDQKYEKVASVATKSKSFEEDEKSVRGLASNYSALIQFEQSSGLAGHRHVELAIGVPPNRFDPMVAELKEIGELSSIRIDKTDKTNEYKELKAKRASLEKTHDSLISLKSKGGRIDEFTNLENRILEIDEEIQSTGVKLGDYDQENEFCTVKLSLAEIGAPAIVPGISFRHRVVVALAWTIRYYTILLAFLFFGAALTLMVVVILQRLNVIPAPLSQLATAE